MSAAIALRQRYVRTLIDSLPTIEGMDEFDRVANRVEEAIRELEYRSDPPVLRPIHASAQVQLLDPERPELPLLAGPAAEETPSEPDAGGETIPAAVEEKPRTEPDADGAAKAFIDWAPGGADGELSFAEFREWWVAFVGRTGHAPTKPDWKHRASPTGSPPPEHTTLITPGIREQAERLIRIWRLDEPVDLVVAWLEQRGMLPAPTQADWEADKRNGRLPKVAAPAGDKPATFTAAILQVLKDAHGESLHITAIADRALKLLPPNGYKPSASPPNTAAALLSQKKDHEPIVSVGRGWWRWDVPFAEHRA